MIKNMEVKAEWSKIRQFNTNMGNFVCVCISDFTSVRHTQKRHDCYVILHCCGQTDIESEICCFDYFTSDWVKVLYACWQSSKIVEGKIFWKWFAVWLRFLFGTGCIVLLMHVWCSCGGIVKTGRVWYWSHCGMVDVTHVTASVYF